jgi:hypothetical protein
MDSMKMALTDKGWEFVDWINMAEDRDQRRAPVSTVMKHQVP